MLAGPFNLFDIPYKSYIFQRHSHVWMTASNHIFLQKAFAKKAFDLVPIACVKSMYGSEKRCYFVRTLFHKKYYRNVTDKTLVNFICMPHS